MFRVLGVEAAANAAALTKLLSSSASSGAKPPSVVTLDVAGAPCRAVLDHVAALYNAAATVDIATPLDIHLRAGDALISREHLTPDLGYELEGHVAMGGTFDRLHPGHKVLLTNSLLSARDRLRIGVTGPALLAKKAHADMLQPFPERCAAVERFVRAIREDLAYDVVELTEPTGGTTTIPDVTGMVVSPETLPTVNAVNAERVKNGLQPVRPIMIDYVQPVGAERVSSTELRARAKRALSPSDAK